ncbi:YgaP family membrane protein [Pseudoneobacillus sp. C159]
MNIRPNIGILNALIRITCGLTILAWSTSKMVKRPWGDRYLFTAMIGAMKVAEGIVRYCPMTDLCKRWMENRFEDERVDGDLGESSEIPPYNPT